MYVKKQEGPDHGGEWQQHCKTYASSSKESKNKVKLKKEKAKILLFFIYNHLFLYTLLHATIPTFAQENATFYRTFEVS